MPAEIETKVCVKCGENKPLDCFSKQKGVGDGLRYQCKTCVSVYFNKYRIANTERLYERHRVWCKANRDKCNKSAKRYKAKYPDKAKQKARRDDGRYRELLTDSHIKKIVNAGSGLKFSDIPQEVVELKRIHIQLLREIRKQAS